MFHLASGKFSFLISQTPDYSLLILEKTAENSRLIFIFMVYGYVAGQIELSGQFVSTKVNLFQLRSICFNPGQFGAGTKHRSQVIFLPMQKVC